MDILIEDMAKFQIFFAGINVTNEIRDLKNKLQCYHSIISIHQLRTKHIMSGSLGKH